MGLRILVIEDDALARQTFAETLERDGHYVRQCADAAAARAALGADIAELVVLDWELPGDSSANLAIELMSKGGVEIIAVATWSTPEALVRALDGGADDYLTAPVDPAELAARVRARARRRQPVYQFAGMRLDQARRVLLDEASQEIVLSRGEFEILAQLVTANGNVVPREALSRVISRAEESDPRSVDALVSRLRRKLSPRDLIVTAPGFGYRLRESRNP